MVEVEAKEEKNVSYNFLVLLPSGGGDGQRN